MFVARSGLYIKQDNDTAEIIYLHDINDKSFYGVFGVAEDFAPMDLRETDWKEVEDELDMKTFTKEVKRWKLVVNIFETEQKGKK